MTATADAKNTTGFGFFRILFVVFLFLFFGFMARADVPAIPSKGQIKIFKDCVNCPEMVVVPSGTFMMGASDADAIPDGWIASASTPGGREFLRALETERPRHQVSLANQFALSARDITFSDWQICAADGGCEDAQRWSYAAGWGENDRPITHISWERTQDYVSWLNKKQDRRPVPAAHTDCRVRRNGNIQPVQGLVPFAIGAMRLEETKPIVVFVLVNGRISLKPLLLVALRLINSVCSICWGISNSGHKIAGIKAIEEHQAMGRRGQKKTVISTCGVGALLIHLVVGI